MEINALFLRAMVGPVGGGAYPPVIPRVLWIHCSDLSVVALSEIGPVGGLHSCVPEEGVCEQVPASEESDTSAPSGSAFSCTFSIK